MVLLGWIFAIALAIVVVAIVVAFLNRFYRKSTRDVALIRTGFGGQKTILAGGCLALPFLHRVEEINMRTIRVEVRRTSEKSLITTDRIRVDAEFEFYVRVQPTVDGVATAAQALGARALSPEGIRNLLEGRFVDALQAVAAARTMDSLHEQRGEFVQQVAEQLRENLSHNGVLLDSVSLTRLDQAPFAALDENNAFNAVGMRRLAEIISANRKKRTEVEAEAEIAVRQTQLDATKRRLSLAQQEEQAQIEQRLEIERIKSASEAEAAKAREDALIASEAARILRERETRLVELAKQSEIRRVEIESQLNSEVRKSDSAIRLADKHAEEAQAQARAERARAEIILAQEHVQTERERAVVERSREIAVKREQEAGEVASAKAESEASVLIRRAQSEAQAVRTRAEAERLRMLAESEGSRALIDAENTRSDGLVRLQLERYRLDKMPEIVAQMMKPVEKIDSIRIHQVSGLTGAPGSGGAGDATRPPVNQVMDSIMGMALQLPALKSIGDSIGVDFSSAVGLAAPSQPAGRETAAAPRASE
ncbi:MAG: flotillin domain-containing protein [Burkholderiaceae bacterium]|nr:flotillin domain-containing protein [Burkholderiaceae bacterium]